MLNLQDIVKNINNNQKFQGSIVFAEPMKNHTTIKVGGDAQIFSIPKNEKSLCFLLKEIRSNKIPYFILGGGSNIVVSDSGIEGFVISTENIHSIDLFTLDGSSPTVRCASGCSIEKLIQFCIDNELSGLESFAGLPGTVGGALFMNARCYEASISDVLLGAQYIDENSTVATYTMDSRDWDYKKSPFQSTILKPIILSADFVVKKGVKKDIQEKCNFYINDRKTKGHFSYPSAGSVFKNNRDFGKTSGQIIDSVGLKGFTVGKAQIAPWHGNLIINLGGASADNIKEIVEYVQKKVLIESGNKLECEILFIGENFV